MGLGSCLVPGWAKGAPDFIRPKPSYWKAIPYGGNVHHSDNFWSDARRILQNKNSFFTNQLSVSMKLTALKDHYLYL